LADRLGRAPGWVSVAEVSYPIWGERGVIDRLAFHSERRMLGILELKADLGDPAGLVAQVDRYRRLAPEIARGRGWEAAAARCWAVVADRDTNRRWLAAISRAASRCVPGRGPRARGLAARSRCPGGRPCVPRIPAPTDWHAEPDGGQAGQGAPNGVHSRVSGPGVRAGAWERRAGRVTVRVCGYAPRDRVRRGADCVPVRACGLRLGTAPGSRAGPAGHWRYIITRPPSTASTWPVM
jgi:hypothetical protein